MIELAHDPEYHRREWLAGRICLIVLLLLMAGLLAGIFGEGPLSRAEARTPDGALRVEYQRFGRFGRATRVVVHAPAPAAGSMRLDVSRALLDAYHIQQITPRPGAARIRRDGVEYRFDLATPGPATVVFDVLPARRWFVEGAVRAPQTGAAVRLSQFIYP